MKIECIHVCVTGLLHCTVEKNCIEEITVKTIVKKKEKENGHKSIEFKSNFTKNNETNIRKGGTLI